MSNNNRSDDFDTMSFRAIRPKNPQYKPKPKEEPKVQLGDMSGFEDCEPDCDDEPFGNEPYYSDDDEDSDDSNFFDNYYRANSTHSRTSPDKFIVGIIIAACAIAFAIIVAIAATISANQDDKIGPKPHKNDIAPIQTVIATEAVIATEVEATEAEETTTEETTTEEVTEAETTTEETTTTVITTEIPTTQLITEPPATEEPKTEAQETIAPPTTQIQEEFTKPPSEPEPETRIDIDPEIPGIQYVE